MTPDEIHRLLEAYLDGTIGEAEAHRLAGAVRGGGAEAATLLRELEFTGLLGQALEDAGDEAFLRSLEERRRAREGEADFIRAFERRARRRAVRRRLASWRERPSFLAAAAAVLLLVLGIAAVLLRTPAPPALPAPPADTPAAVAESGPPTPPAPPTLLPPTESPAPPEPSVEVSPSRERVPEPLPVPLEEPVFPPSRLEVAESVPSPLPEPTRPAPLLVLQEVLGQVFVLNARGRVPARKGEEISAGQGLVIPDPSGRGVLLFEDGTRLEVHGGAWIRDFFDPARPSVKRVVMTQGVVEAEVKPQSADRPMVFATPHAEVRVLGTSLRLSVDAAATLLEVRSGRVRLLREGRAADVAAGQYAIAGPGFPLSPRAADVEEIVLLPREATLVGAEWALVRDPRSSSGLALEAVQAPYRPIDHVERRPAWASFRFYAPADREYRLWIRAASLATGDPWTRDMLTVEPRGAQLSRRSPFFGEAPTNAYVIDGVSAASGYSWVGSRADEGKSDPPPLGVRYPEAGLHELRLYTVHRSIRVDALWLSATQKARPAARQFPPAEGR